MTTFHADLHCWIGTVCLSFLISVVRTDCRLRNGICRPEDEEDFVPDSAIWCVAIACVAEGILLAIFVSVTSGTLTELNTTGFYTQESINQILRFAPILLLALHRILRPANRLDPMRTVLELEVVCVCWDALDGATLFSLVRGKNFHSSVVLAIAVLMAVWYVSVGLRTAVMVLSMLSPNSKGYQLILMPPFALANLPTVDRTLQSLRLRSIIILIMATAEFFAAALRLNLWINGHLDPLQQDMCIKNVLFLSSVYAAYDMYVNSTERNW